MAATAAVQTVAPVADPKPPPAEHVPAVRHEQQVAAHDRRLPFLCRGLKEVVSLAEILVRSGFFRDLRDSAQGVVKILAGREMGFPEVTSLMGVYMTPEGKIGIAANLMAAAIKRSGRYNYRVNRHTNDACEITFYEGRTPLGISTFSMTDAKAAGLLVSRDGKPSRAWQRYPRNMLFARALSNGARWYTPDIFGGVTPYTPDEIDDNVEIDDEGSVVVPATVTPQQAVPSPSAPPINTKSPYQRMLGLCTELGVDYKRALRWASARWPNVKVNDFTPEQLAEFESEIRSNAPKPVTRQEVLDIAAQMEPDGMDADEAGDGEDEVIEDGRPDSAVPW